MATTRKRRPLTKTQREIGTATRSGIKLREHRLASSEKEHNLRRLDRSHLHSEARTTTIVRESQRRQTGQELSEGRLALAQRRAQLASQRSLQNQALRATNEGISTPSVSLAGGITRTIFMAIVLIVVYALVTHSQSSSTAIQNVGGIFGKLTSTQPLFVKASG